MDQPQNVNWLTVLTTLIVGLPLILGAMTTLVALLWKIFSELQTNTRLTRKATDEVKATLIERDAKADKVAVVAVEVAAKAMGAVDSKIDGIAKTINGHSDKRVEDAARAAFAEGVKSATDEHIAALSNSIVEIQKWQENHGRVDEENMREIRQSLTELLKAK